MKLVLISFAIYLAVLFLAGCCHCPEGYVILPSPYPTQAELQQLEIYKLKQGKK